MHRKQHSTYCVYHTVCSWQLSNHSQFLATCKKTKQRIPTAWMRDFLLLLLFFFAIHKSLHLKRVMPAAHVCKWNTQEKLWKKKKKKKTEPSEDREGAACCCAPSHTHTHTQKRCIQNQEIQVERQRERTTCSIWCLRLTKKKKKDFTSVDFPHVEQKKQRYIITREKERVNAEAHTYRSASRRWGLVTCVIAVRALSHSQRRRLKPCVSVHFCFVFFWVCVCVCLACVCVCVCKREGEGEKRERESV